jgi:hypothetical protein
MARNPIVDLLPKTMVCEEPIYHYTDAGGFLGMIEYHALWATEVFGLNDVSELTHGWDFIRVWLKAQVEDRVIEAMLDHVPESGDEAGTAEIFVCCASTLKDDASQWRLYADQARGYAVELDPDVDLAIGARNEAFPGGKPPAEYTTRQLGTMLRDHAEVSPWMHVLYTEDSKASALEALQQSLVRRFEEFDRRLASDPTEEEWALMLDDRSSEVRGALHMLAQFMKAEAFSGESEVRMVGTVLYDVHCKFRASPYGVVRYVRLVTRDRRTKDYRVDTGSASRLPVKSVRLGPRQVAQNSRGAALSLLNRCDYTAPILTSTATLR